MDIQYHGTLYKAGATVSDDEHPELVRIVRKLMRRQRTQCSVNGVVVKHGD